MPFLINLKLLLKKMRIHFYSEFYADSESVSENSKILQKIYMVWSFNNA